MARAPGSRFRTTAAATLLLTGCTSPGSGDTSGGEIAVGTQPWIGYGQWYVAEEEGILDELGLTVEQTVLNTDADKTSAFVSGQIDVANMASHTAMLLLEQGVDVKIIMVEDYSTTADAMLAGPEIGSIDDLAGARVAYEQGATSDLLLHAALDEAGLTMGDITPVPMAASEAATALIAGHADVAVTYEPYITTAMQESSNLSLIYDAASQPGLISDVLVASGELVESDPELLQLLVDAWGQAVDRYNEDPHTARAIIAAAVGEDAEALATAFDGVEFFGAAENAEAFSGDYVDTVLPLVMQASIDAGILSGEVDLEALYDSRFATD